MSSALRRLPLSRLLLACGVGVAVGIGATALALALGTGPVPPPKPLAQAIHDALQAPKAQGVSARIQLTNHLLEGASLASNGGEAGQLSKSPLLSGASGRLWIASDGHARLELQSEKGDTQILWDGHTAELYDASTNTLYRYTPQARQTSGGAQQDRHETPTVAHVQEGIDRLGKHAYVSGATPTDVAGQPAYTVRVAPRENGGLFAGAELSWDAVHGVPLRAAIYSTNSDSPVVELVATDISYGPVQASVFDFAAPADAKVQEITPPRGHGSGEASGGGRPHVTVHGKGLGAIVVAESQVKPGSKPAGGGAGGALEGLPQVDVNGAKAAELQTELGTLLSFKRNGTRYLLAGSVTPATIEAFARSL